MQDRPNPEDLLKKVKEEKNPRGKLKIFFGAVAGVGKTYAMLEAARLRKKEGIDVLVGIVETHKRQETQALLEGLEILKSKNVVYKNVNLQEFDLDAAIKRNPKLILIDELAHTNAQGLRHNKRWQDVEELLDNGIDVYTTLNVQHCESANDVVFQVTGVVVRETIPDTFLEKADEIELVDLPSEELLKRLKDGKVYLGQQANYALEHFFQPGNLIALRQLALRYTAHNVDEKLLSYKKMHSIYKVWNVRERFLVCISPSPNAFNLIRAGKRIASDLAVEWMVAYVGNTYSLSLKDKARLNEMIQLAEKLGAKVVTLNGQNIADTLITYARSKNITKIIVGKPGKTKLKEIIFGSIIDKLARKCGEIDLYLLSGDLADKTVNYKPRVLPDFSWPSFLKTINIIALCTLFDWFFLTRLSPVNLVMIYLLGVTLVAYQYGRRMSIIASFLSVLFFDYFFLPPYFSMQIKDLEYILTFIIMLLVGFIIANLTGQLRKQNLAMQARQEKTEILYDLSRDLAKTSYPDELFKIVVKHVEELLKGKAIVFTFDKNSQCHFREEKSVELNSNELAVVQWVYQNSKVAGRGTDTLPGAKGIYLPFIGVEKTVGVIGVFLDNNSEFINLEQLHILEMFVKQTALAVEGAELALASLEAQITIDNERLKNVFLTTFSRELPSQLNYVSDTVKELLKPENIENANKREVLLGQIKRDVDNLNDLLSELAKIINLNKAS